VAAAGRRRRAAACTTRISGRLCGLAASGRRADVQLSRADGRRPLSRRWGKQGKGWSAPDWGARLPASRRRLLRGVADTRRPHIPYAAPIGRKHHQSVQSCTRRQPALRVLSEPLARLASPHGSGRRARRGAWRAGLSPSPGSLRTLPGARVSPGSLPPALSPPLASAPFTGPRLPHRRGPVCERS
jgi:hypothetical protein